MEEERNDVIPAVAGKKPTLAGGPRPFIPRMSGPFQGSRLLLGSYLRYFIWENVIY